MVPLRIVKHYKIPRNNIKIIAKTHMGCYYRFGEKLAFSLNIDYGTPYNKILGRTNAEDGMNFTGFMTRHKLIDYLCDKNIRIMTFSLYQTSLDDAKKMMEDSLSESKSNLNIFFDRYKNNFLYNV